MFCSKKYFSLSNSPLLRVLYFYLDNISCKNMSVIDINTVEKTNKRQIVDENNEVAIKTKKLEDVVEEVAQKFKKKNYVIMLGYLGIDYLGMQRNPAIKTIEEDLLSALLKSNLITKEQFDDIREVNFQRAARTDKGVSAVRQIVSLKLPDHVNKEDINKHLPEEIKVFGIKRVTRRFNSKNQCDARTYRYVLPTYALAPENQDFLETKEELVKDERYNKLCTINGKPYKEFRVTTDMLDKLNETLKLFEGTHNFHNFTSKIRPMDPRARRYIIYFRWVEKFIANDMEFVVLEVKGQSFMLHQIRKMVTLVVGVSRNILTNDFIKDAFSNEKCYFPPIPGFGLSLHHVHYKHYNKRYGQDGIHQTLNWDECNEEIEQFYKQYILKTITSKEASEQLILNWLTNFLTPERYAFKELNNTSVEHIL